VGFDGSVTGRRVDVLIIDDPVKNYDQVATPEAREHTWQTYRQVLLTRLNPGAIQVVIATRWHEDDFAGRLLTQADPWTVIRLPALAEEGDLLGRELGEPLWPEHHSLQMLQGRQTQLGNADFSALYQQRPVPAGGGLVKRKWFRYWAEPPSVLDECLMSWDMSFGTLSEGASYVVGQVWARRGADIYLLDQVRAQMTMPQTVEAMRELGRKWPQAVLKLVENTANGPAVIQTLQHTVGGLVPVDPKGGKLARLQAVLPLIEAGNVHLPQGAGWGEDFLVEVTAFPTGRYDDQVDAMSQALERFLPHSLPAAQQQNVPRGRPDGRVFGPRKYDFKLPSWDPGIGYGITGTAPGQRIKYDRDQS
jgi:predicted phage terminase large subunit-like protein